MKRLVVEPSMQPEMQHDDLESDVWILDEDGGALKTSRSLTVRRGMTLEWSNPSVLLHHLATEVGCGVQAWLQIHQCGRHVAGQAGVRGQVDTGMAGMLHSDM